jgi:RimJ/RimL family protein N-acetyltransferase
MSDSLMFNHLMFVTERLNVEPIDHYLRGSKVSSEFLFEIISILSSVVVKSLPSYFHGVNGIEQAEAWLNKMRSESHFYIISNSGANRTMGFLFLYEADNGIVHLGYLLGKQYWGQGYATELLVGLVDQVKVNNLVKTFVAGVEEENVASIKTLRKASFVECSKDKSDGLFYQYTF